MREKHYKLGIEWKDLNSCHNYMKHVNSLPILGDILYKNGYNNASILVGEVDSL